VVYRLTFNRVSAIAEVPCVGKGIVSWVGGCGSKFGYCTFIDCDIATLTVTDNSGATATDTRKIQVNNVAPTITNISSDTTLFEGTPANFSATATDPGNDIHQH